jgi:hypothetical protein
VKARIIQVLDPSVEIGAELNDRGVQGDRVAQDTIFSQVLPELPPGEYRVVLELADDKGNSRTDNFDLTKK